MRLAHALAHAIDAVGAKRVVLDTIETLFGALGDEALLRGELRRLFGWLKERGMTTVVTAERGDGTLTRYGMEEYVSDCVILLDHRVRDEASTRRLRIVKYPGSAHGSNEYPFMIDTDGLSVFPLTSVSLAHKASEERVETGVYRLAFRRGPVLSFGSRSNVAHGRGHSLLLGAVPRGGAARISRVVGLAVMVVVAPIRAARLSAYATVLLGAVLWGGAARISRVVGLAVMVVVAPIGTHHVLC